MTARPAEHFAQDIDAAQVRDRRLTLAFQNGDQGAYRVIYDNYSPRVHNICRRMLSNVEDAREAAQESFLRIYQGLGCFNGRYQLQAWITRVTTNVCLDILRSKGRRPADLFSSEELEIEAGTDQADDPEVVCIKRAESRRIRRTLDSLPPIHRAAIVLRDFEGFSYAETAETLGISESQVKALLHRARKGFKRSWGGALLSALFPARLIDRLKGAESVTQAPVAHTVSPVFQSACICVGPIQQLGQLATDHALALVTAMVVGGTSIAVPSLMAEERPQDVQTQTTTATSGDDRARGASSSSGTGTSVDGRSPGASGSNQADPSLPPGTSPSPSPSESPSSPSPSPSPTKPPTTGGGGSGGASAPPQSPSPDPRPSPLPGYGPLRPILAFDRGRDATPTDPVSNQMTVDCGTLRVEQRLETTISNGTEHLPATLLFSASGSIALELKVSKNKKTVNYSGGGPLVSNTGTGNEMHISYAGSYGTGGSKDAKSLGLPDGGRFTLDLKLDCSGLRIFEEKATFRT